MRAFRGLDLKGFGLKAKNSGVPNMMGERLNFGTIWMEAQSTSTTATFMSTHPSSTKRISELQKNNPQVKRDYAAAALFPSSSTVTSKATTPTTTTSKSTTSTKKSSTTTKKSSTGWSIGN